MRKKILSVDDDALNRDILTEYLTDGGYEVIEADDGDTALFLLNEMDGIDAIVLDRMMPRLNGMEVLRTVKADPRLSHIPVIMQSAASAREQILQGIKAGVYYYLTKPYEDQMLLAIVGAALSDASSKKRLRAEVNQQKRVLGLMEQSRFRFRTLEEAESCLSHRELLPRAGRGRVRAERDADQCRRARQSWHNLRRKNAAGAFRPSLRGNRSQAFARGEPKKMGLSVLRSRREGAKCPDQGSRRRLRLASIS